MNNEVTLSAEELWFIAQNIGPGIMIGFKDPTEGLLTTQKKELVELAKISLTEKQIITEVDDAHYIIDDEVGESVRGLLNPKHTLLTGFVDNLSNVHVCSFNFVDEKIFVLDEVNTGEYKLHWNFDRGEISRELLENLGQKIFMYKEDVSFNASETTISAARELISKNDLKGAQALFMGQNIQESYINSFLDAQQNLQKSFSFVLFKNRNNPDRSKVNGFAVLISKMNLWILELVNEQEKISKVRQISKQQLIKRFATLLPIL